MYQLANPNTSPVLKKAINGCRDAYSDYITLHYNLHFQNFIIKCDDKFILLQYIHLITTMHFRLKHFFKRSLPHHAKPVLLDDSDIFQLHSPQKDNETSSLPPPAEDRDHLEYKTSSLPPAEAGDHLENETSSLPPPAEDGDHLENETSSLPPPAEDGNHLENETSSLPPPAEDYQPKNESFTIFPSYNSHLQDEDEPSFLNSTIPILPPPMPSLQLLSHAHLPFQPPAPLACSTPQNTVLSSPLEQYKKKGRESHRAPQLYNKQGRKAVRKNARAKEMMSKRRQKRGKW